MSEEVTFSGFETLALHAGHDPGDDRNARAVPIYATTSFVFEDSAQASALFALEEAGNLYTRVNNPTQGVLEERVAALEGGVGALALASGQAATSLALLTLAKQGDNIVTSSDLYGGTLTLFKDEFSRLGIEARFVDGRDFDAFRDAIDEKTKAVFVEFIGNPRLDVIDIETIAGIAHEAGVPLVVDATTVTPYLSRPIEWGADIVVHSATKYLGGHGTAIAGIIVDSGKFDWTNGRFPEFTEPVESYHGITYTGAFGEAAFITKARVQLLRAFGPAISPFNAFLILQGIETLAVRLDRHNANALAVAKWLQNHPKVERVIYPGLPDHPSYELAQKYLPKGQSGLVGFGIKGGAEAGARFIDSLKLLSHLVNIGDAKSLAVHPWSSTHRQLTSQEKVAAGVTEDFVRLSVGIETLDDILADIDQALAQA